MEKGVNTVSSDPFWVGGDGNGDVQVDEEQGRG